MPQGPHILDSPKTENSVARLPSQGILLNKNFLIQYGVSLGSGVASFLGLSGLGHVIQDENFYSAAAAILATFNTYFVFMDLGYNNELMRDLQSAAAEEKSRAVANGFLSLLYLRLLLCATIVPLAMIQGFLSSPNSNHSASFGIFALSHIFYATLLTFDSLHFAEGAPNKATAVKIVRLIANLTLPIFLYFWPDELLESIFYKYLAAVIALTLLSAALQRRLLARVLQFGIIPNAEYFRSFVNRIAKSAAFPTLAVVGAFMVQTALFHGQGLTSLATYVAAVSLLSPISTGMQTISQLMQRDLGGWAASDLFKARQQIRKCNRVIAVIGVIGIIGILLFYHAGIIQLFLKHVDSNFPLYLTLLGIQQTMASMQVQLVNFLQFRKRFRIMFTLGSVLTILTTLIVSKFSISDGATGNLISGTILGLLSLVAFLRVASRELKGDKPC